MAFINRFSTTQHGAIAITGNTLGLSKANNNNSPGINDSIGGFITTNIGVTAPAAWAGIVNLANEENITLSWQLNSSSAYLNMPAGSTVLYAELIWGGLGKSNTVDVSNFLNNQILFISPLGTNAISPNSLNNFFASQINIGDSNNVNVGTIDVTGSFGTRNSNAFTGTNISGGRQGWDITNVNGSSSLVNGQTSAIVRFSSTSELYMPNGLAIQIDTIYADVSIIKTDTPDPVIAGHTLTYTMVVSNAGPSNAQNVTLTDIIPSEIINPQYSLDGGVVWNSWFSPNPLGTLASGSSLTILIKGRVTPGCPFK